MRTLAWVLFVLSGLVPLVGLLGTPPDPMLLVYTLFVVACLLRRPLRALADRLPGPVALHLLLSFWVAGSVTETLAWASNYLEAAEEPALLHPQLFADLILGLGFYGGWAAAWLIACRWFRFTLAETFVVTGLQGIFLEQLGAVFLMMVRVFSTQPGMALVLGLYVFLVHGSAVGLAMVPVLHRLDRPERSRHIVRFVVVVALMVGLAFAGTWLASTLTLPFGGLPPKQSITEHPLW
jgi:hypothetical protein